MSSRPVTWRGFFFPIALALMLIVTACDPVLTDNLVLQERLPGPTPWMVVHFDDAEQVVAFLNGTDGSSSLPILEAKVSVYGDSDGPGFEVFYRRAGLMTTSRPFGQWSYRSFETTGPLRRYLNGFASPRAMPARDAFIGGPLIGGETVWYAFVTRDGIGEAKFWGEKSFSLERDLVNYINGEEGSTPKGKVRIVRSHLDGRYHAFYQVPTRYQMRGIWSDPVSYDSSEQLLERLNRLPGAGYPRPVHDGKVLMARGHGSYSLFIPQGMAVVTRPKFVPRMRAYARSKFEFGLETTVVTADWIDEHVSATIEPVDELGTAASLDEPLPFKIRNFLRSYYRDMNASYALLVGDAIPSDSVPPDSGLSESWNLPQGYYFREHDDGTHNLRTTLFYADLTDKMHYLGVPADDNVFTGDYAIRVGLIPVRTVDELDRVLYKSTHYPLADEMHIIVSDDLADLITREHFETSTRPFVSEVAPDFVIDFTIIEGTDSLDMGAITGPHTPHEEVYELYFHSRGIVKEHGHGNVASFRLGATQVMADDAGHFRQVNPLHVIKSCLTQAYHLDEDPTFHTPVSASFDEAILKARQGPAVVSNMGFASYNRLFTPRLTVGELFSRGGSLNPNYLFGDPTLVIFAEPTGWAPMLQMNLSR